MGVLVREAEHTVTERVWRRLLVHDKVAEVMRVKVDARRGLEAVHNCI